MTYHVEFYAHTPKEAASVVADDVRTNLPAGERAKLVAALSNMRHEGVVYVKATGHVCDGPGSHEESWGDFQIRCIHFVKMPTEAGSTAS